MCHLQTSPNKFMFHKTAMKCTYPAVACTSPFHFSYTPAGQLMRDNSKESYITDVSGPIIFIKINCNKNSIAILVPWTDALNIFIGH